jgi:hypothetical protein
MNETQIANASLRMLGAARIADLAERSPEAECIRDVWALTRDALLRAYRWNFAKRTATLSRDSAGNWPLPPNTGNDEAAVCLRVLRVNGVVAGLRGGPEIFGRGIKMPAHGRLHDSVTAEYIARVPVVEWDASFVHVFQYLLAAQIAPGLSAASGKSQELRREAESAIRSAIEANAIETAPLVVGACDNPDVSDTGLDAFLAGL